MPRLEAVLQSEPRTPRVQVLLDGAALPGVISVDVETNNHYAADRFRVSLAASGMRQDALHAPGVHLDVQVALAGDWISLVVGAADTISFDPVYGVLDVDGRDLSSSMIEARVDETFANRTSSEIAELFAGRHGLGAEVQQTATPVGRYFQSEYDGLTMGQFAKRTTEWELLAFLAGQEGFDLFMDGETLRFGPPTDDDPVVLRREDCTSLRLAHSLNMAREIEVTVRSWGARAGAAVVQTARAGSGGATWKHGLVRPNMTPDEAQRLAERVLSDLQRHEWTATAEMPGDVTLTPRSRVAIDGTGTVWDRSYAVSELSRHLDVRRGFLQRISLQGLP